MAKTSAFELALVQEARDSDNGLCGNSSNFDEKQYHGCNICGVKADAKSGSYCDACEEFNCSGCKQDRTCVKCVQGWTLPWSVTEGSADVIEFERVKPGTKKLLEIGHRHTSALVQSGMHRHYVTQALVDQSLYMPIARACALWSGAAVPRFNWQSFGRQQVDLL